MATWFARKSANIDAANVWNSAEDGSGSWLTWPPAPSDVLVTGPYILNVTVSFTVAEVYQNLTGGTTPAGWLNFNTSGVTATANFYSQAYPSVVRIAVTSGTVNLVGNIYAGTTVNAWGVYIPSGAGTVNITGNIYGNVGTQPYGLYTAGSYNGTINITGNLYAGASSTGYGAAIDSPSTMVVTGNVLNGGSTSPGLSVQNAAATATINGYAQAGSTGVGVLVTTTATVTITETRSASNGRPAVAGAFRYASATAAKSLPIIAGTQKTLSVLDVAALVPAEADVRQGVTYGDGAYTGTLPLQRKRASMAGRF